MTKVQILGTGCPKCARLAENADEAARELGLDYELERLFIPHFPDQYNPDSGNGFITVWDVTDPSMPEEITVPGERPTVSVYPYRVSIL
jgi:hypothetical protein